MPFKPHPTDPNRMVYTPPRYNLSWNKREWVGLTDDEADTVWTAFRKENEGGKLIDLVRRTEAKLKEKNS